MNEIHLKNLRCFTDLGWTRIAPLTVLIGENSAGKSTFLAATRLAWDIAYGRHPIDFNESPFQLGAYEQLAHYYGGRGGRAKSFEVGLRATGRGSELTFSAEFAKKGSQPEIVNQAIETAEGSVAVALNEGSRQHQLRFTSTQGQLFDFSPEEMRIPRLDTRFDWDMLSYIISRHARLREENTRMPSGEQIVALRRLIQSSRLQSGHRPYAFAPVRVRPQRTYDPVRETPDPEGEHVPMVLARTFFTDKKRWRVLKEALDRFGKVSGLFQSIDVKTLGRSDSDPFQLRVTISGPPANMIDVGYGVSQVLPLLVESLSAPNRQTFLMQQPEVHLHPRAQAELGSFLGTLVKTANKRFLVETQSDYLLDRIRMDVRDRHSLSPSDVVVLYFERVRGDVHVRTLGLDNQGNLTAVPRNFRKFFLDEERRLLGLT